MRFMHHPGQFLINGKALVSTFAGETCTFGSGSPAQAWFDQFVGHPDLKGKIHFVPSFFGNPAEFGADKDLGKSLDGVFNWNGAWPVELTTDKVRGSGSILGPIGTGLAQGTQNAGISDALSGLLGDLIGSADADKPYLDAIKGKTYMTSVSPWFFTHYGADSFDKNVSALVIICKYLVLTILCA
jgi:glucan endo-1,3-alpha-glucosidase